MNEYTVEWSIDINADSALEAARIARDIQRDPNSWANYFEVHHNGTTVDIDLDTYEPEEI